MKKITFLLALLLLVSATIFANDPKDDIMLQSFGWDEYDQPKIKAAGNFYKFVESKASEWKAAGFDMIWMPPPSRSSGGVGYLPTELHNFNSTWGSEADLRAATAALKAHGMFPIADVVANHRNGTTAWTDFTNPAWSCATITSTDEANTGWVASLGPKPCGAPDTGDDFNGGRDLDHTNIETRNGIKAYLIKLKEQGFEGWRWDMTKGFSASYVGEYNTASQPYFSVGEYWDGNSNTLKNWVDGTGKKSATFDFSQYYALETALQRNGWSALGSGSRMAGLAGVSGYSDYAVTFVDNHDTFVHGSAPLGDNIMKAYAYILTHPGIPSVFIAHYYGGTYKKDNVTRTYTSHKDKIDPIMAVRKANRIDAWSTLQVATNSGMYAAYIKRRHDDAAASVAVKIGPGSWSPEGSGWILAASGTDYAVWSKAQIVVAPTMLIGSGTYELGQTLSITAPSGYSIRYTTDGSEPTAASTLYTTPITLPQGTTVIKAASFLNGVMSAVVTNTYTAQAKATSIKVRFKAPASWTASKAYVWENRNGTDTDLAGAWPGTTATKDADGFYVYTITNHTQLRVNIIFNNASGTAASEQTEDLSVTADICWQAVGSNKYGVETVNCPGTNVENNYIRLFNIYPNPGKETVRINTNETLRAVTMYDNMGRMHRMQLNADNSLDISNMAAGLYQMQIETESGRKETHKFVKL